MRRPIALFLTLLFILQPLLAIAQESKKKIPEELPEALGMYIKTKQKLIEWGKVGIHHAEDNEIRLYKQAGSSTPDVKPHNLFFLSYFSFGARNPEDFRLYRLKPRATYKPGIEPETEIELILKPITGKPGILGNMVKVVPKTRLRKSNYILTEGSIRLADSAWLFSVDGGYRLWKKEPSGCIKGAGYVLGAVVVIVAIIGARWLGAQIGSAAGEALY